LETCRWVTRSASSSQAASRSPPTTARWLVSSTSAGQRSSSSGAVPLKKRRLRPFTLIGNMFSTATVIPVSSRMRGMASSSPSADWVCQRHGGGGRGRGGEGHAVGGGQGAQPVRVLAQPVLHDHQLGAVEAGLADQLEGLLEREHEEGSRGGRHRGERRDR